MVGDLVALLILSLIVGTLRLQDKENTVRADRVEHRYEELKRRRS
jgi:hypothetical protein